MHGQRMRPVGLRLCQMARMACKHTDSVSSGYTSAGCRCAKAWKGWDGKLLYAGPTAGWLLSVCLAAELVLA